MHVSPELETTEVFDLSGERHPVGSLYADQPTIIVWLRHYG